MTDSIDEGRGRVWPLRKALPLARIGGTGWRWKDARDVSQKDDLRSVPVPFGFLWLVLAVLIGARGGQRSLRRGWPTLVLRRLGPKCDSGRLRRACPLSCRLRTHCPAGVAGVRDCAVALVRRKRRLERSVRRANRCTVSDVRRHLLVGLVPVGRGRDVLLDQSACPAVRASSLDGRRRGGPARAGRRVRPCDPARGRAPTIGALAAFVAFIYPVLDVLLVGAVLGVFGLLGWRPDGTWMLVGLALVSTVRRRRSLCGSAGRGPSRRVRKSLWLRLDGGSAPDRPRRVGRGAEDGSEPGVRNRNASGGPGPRCAGPGHRDSGVCILQRDRQDRADRHHHRVAGGFRADRSHPTTSPGPDDAEPAWGIRTVGEQQTSGFEPLTPSSPVTGEEPTSGFEPLTPSYEHAAAFGAGCGLWVRPPRTSRFRPFRPRTSCGWCRVVCCHPVATCDWEAT